MNLRCLLPLALLAATAHAQSAQTPPQNIPGPISPPKLLTDDPPKLTACTGIAPAEVKVQFSVTAQGTTKNIKVIESPSEKHGNCAAAIVGAYSYVPAMRDGQAVEVQIILTLSVK